MTTPQPDRTTHSWPCYRREALTVAARHVHAGALALELIPADEEAARMSRLLYRLAARIRADAREVAA
jgi:hypothetical protein